MSCHGIFLVSKVLSQIWSVLGPCTFSAMYFQFAKVSGVDVDLWDSRPEALRRHFISPRWFFAGSTARRVAGHTRLGHVLYRQIDLISDISCSPQQVCIEAISIWTDSQGPGK